MGIPVTLPKVHAWSWRNKEDLLLGANRKRGEQQPGRAEVGNFLTWLYVWVGKFPFSSLVALLTAPVPSSTVRASSAACVDPW